MHPLRSHAARRLPFLHQLRTARCHSGPPAGSRPLADRRRARKRAAHADERTTYDLSRPGPHHAGQPRAHHGAPLPRAQRRGARAGGVTAHGGISVLQPGRRAAGIRCHHAAVISGSRPAGVRHRHAADVSGSRPAGIRCHHAADVSGSRPARLPERSPAARI